MERGNNALVNIWHMVNTQQKGKTQLFILKPACPLTAIPSSPFTVEAASYATTSKTRYSLWKLCSRALALASLVASELGVASYVR